MWPLKTIDQSKIPKIALPILKFSPSKSSAVQHLSKHFRVLRRKQGIHPALVGANVKVLQKKQLVFSIFDWIYRDIGPELQCLLKVKEDLS